MGTRKDPQPDDVRRVRETGTLHPNWAVSIKSLPSGAQGKPMEEEAERVEEPEGMEDANKSRSFKHTSDRVLKPKREVNICPIPYLENISD